jgi:hypothetical protein
VPHTYKRSHCSDKVVEQLAFLSSNSGLTLELDWVSVVPF